MNKEEILEISKRESSGLDEREWKLYNTSQIFAGAVMACVCVLFALTFAIQGENIYCPVAILFSYVSATGFHQYKYLKKKASLFQGVFAAFVTVVNINFFLWS